MKKLKDAYFEDRLRANEIQRAILESIKPGDYYHVIIMALLAILNRMIEEWSKAENNNRWHGDIP